MRYHVDLPDTPSGHKPATGQDRLLYPALLLLILLAFALRLYRLSAQDLWGDEAFSVSLSLQPLDKIVTGGADTHPPFYPLLLFAWLRLLSPVAGDTGAFATRALSALIGTLVVPALFVLARRLTATRVAWIAAGLAAVSPLLIYYSQETRMYELVTWLALVSAAFGVKLVDRAWTTSHRRDIVGYLVFTALAFYTHYSAFFLWAAVNVYAAARLRRDRAAFTRWAALQLVLMAAYVPWVLVQTTFLQNKANARFDEWSWRGVELVLGKTLLAFSAGLTLDAPVIQAAAAVFLFVAVVGMLAAWRTNRTWPQWSLAPLLFIIPVAIAWLVNPIMPFFFERYVLVALPGFYITVAFGLEHLSRRWAYAGIVATGVCFAISALSLSNYYWNDAYAKGKYGQMMAFVQERAQPGDALVLNNPLQRPLFDYYRPRGIPAFYFPEDAPLEDPRTRYKLDEIAHAQRRLWLVMFGNPAEYDPTGYLERWLGAHAFKTLARGYVDASLTLYAMPTASPAVRRSVGAKLGDNVELTAYELDRERAASGQVLQLSLHWRALAPMDKRFKVFTHLVGAPNPATQSPIWAQMDGEPVGGSRPTTLWQVGETIDDLYGLLVPAEAPPGEYVLQIGMYDAETLARLPMIDANGGRVPEDSLVLGTVSVQ